MAGVGKSTLARAYTDHARAQGYYSNGVYWVNACNDSTLIESLRNMAVSWIEQ